MHAQWDIFLYNWLKNKKTVHFKIPCKKYCFATVLHLLAHYTVWQRVASWGIRGWRCVGIFLAELNVPCTLHPSTAQSFGAWPKAKTTKHPNEQNYTTGMYVHIWHCFFFSGTALWLWPMPSPRAPEESRQGFFCSQLPALPQPLWPQGPALLRVGPKQPCNFHMGGRFQSYGQSRSASLGERKKRKNKFLSHLLPTAERKGELGARDIYRA